VKLKSEDITSSSLAWTTKCTGKTRISSTLSNCITVRRLNHAIAVRTVQNASFFNCMSLKHFQLCLLESICKMASLNDRLFVLSSSKLIQRVPSTNTLAIFMTQKDMT
jgi:hypothetical protein